MRVCVQQNDVAKKPRGYIILDSSCKVIRTDSRLFQVSCVTRSVTLAHSHSNVEI